MDIEIEVVIEKSIQIEVEVQKGPPGSEDAKTLGGQLPAYYATVAQVNDKVDKVAGKGLSTEDYTTAEKSKLASLNPLFVGQYISLAALQAAHPVAQIGQYAIVDPGTGIDAVKYIWDDSDQVWILSVSNLVETTDDLPEGVTNLYYSIARVNAWWAAILNAIQTITAVWTFDKRTTHGVNSYQAGAGTVNIDLDKSGHKITQTGAVVLDFINAPGAGVTHGQIWFYENGSALTLTAGKFRGEIETNGVAGTLTIISYTYSADDGRMFIVCNPETTAN